MDQLIKTIEEYSKKAPSLPTNIKDLIVFAPWAAVLSVVVSLPAILALFGINSYFGYAGMGRYVYHSLGADYMARFYITQAFLVANIVLRGLSIPGLFSRSKSGWMFMFYSVLAYGIYSFVTANVIGGIIGLLISLYFMFQVKDYYIKDKAEK